MKDHWYRVEMINGDETYCFFGSTALGEDDFIQKLSGAAFVRLDNIVYFDEEQDAKSWAEWDPNFQSRTYLNPSYVVSVIPLLGDPRRGADAEGKLLSMPSKPEA